MQVKRTMTIVGLLVLLAAFGISAVNAQDDTTVTSANTITVTGLGTAYGEPDVAYVELGVEAINADLGAAFDEANRAIDSVIAALTEAGIDRADIQTTFLNVYQEEIYDPNTGTPSGERRYHVQNFVRVTVRDTAQLGERVSMAVDSGANRINGLNFSILDLAALESTAREAAGADARARAGQLATAFGGQLGSVISVREVFGSSAGGNLGRGGAMMESSAASIAPGALQVSVQIEVTFALE
jgi:hypothetical protein